MALIVSKYSLIGRGDGKKLCENLDRDRFSAATARKVPPAGTRLCARSRGAEETQRYAWQAAAREMAMVPPRDLDVVAVCRGEDPRWRESVEQERSYSSSVPLEARDRSTPPTGRGRWRRGSGELLA